MPFDLNSLTPVAADLPVNERASKPNPFKDWLAESYEEWTADHSKGGRKVVVPAANAVEIKNLIRRAADSLGIGSRVVLTKSNGDVIDQKDKDAMPKSGNVTVLYCGRERKARKSSDDADSTES